MDKGKTYVKNAPVLINASSILYEGGGKTLDKLFDLVYPVGSVYISVNTQNPQTLFGGEWVRLPYGFLLNWSSGEPLTTGGGWETNGTQLSVAQLPSHQHYTVGRTGDGHINPVVVSNYGGSTGGATFPATYGWTNVGSGGYAYVGATGSGQAHSHYHEPPWVKVYVWYRTA